MAAARSGKEDQLKQCSKILQFIMGHKDAAPFLEPVLWKEWGLLDYPKVIKNPMDLGTVKKKLEAGMYSSAKEFKHDASLVWNNCMTYNADGSEYWLLAASLKRIFEEKYSKAIRDSDDESSDFDAASARPPTLLDRKMFSQNIYNVSPEDLGKLVQMLDQRCEACIKKIDAEDIEIDIDSIDNASFWIVDSFVKDCLPGNKKGSASSRKIAGGSAVTKAAAALPPAAGSPADGPSKPKKLRT